MVANRLIYGKHFYNREASKEKIEVSLMALKTLNIMPIISELPDGGTVIQVSDADYERLPYYNLRGNPWKYRAFLVPRPGATSQEDIIANQGFAVEQINVATLIKRYNKRQIYEKKREAEKSNPKMRYLHNVRLISKTKIGGKVLSDPFDKDNPYIEVTMTIEEHIKYHHPETKEWSLSETKNFYILNLVEKHHLQTITFKKFDNNNDGSTASCRDFDIYKTDKQIHDEYQRKKEKEDREPVFAIRGDGAVTTLDRLLSGKSDLAPPGTAPGLNI